MMDFYATIADKAEAFISFHCAAETLLYPMGHTSDTELVPNVDHLVRDPLISNNSSHNRTYFSYEACHC